MKTRRIFPLLIMTMAPLTLTACGEGWVPQQVRGYVPYIEERTAGPGIEYVRAHMLQEKGPKLEPAMVEPAPEPTVEEIINLPPPEPQIKSSEELFEEKLKK